MAVKPVSLPVAGSAPTDPETPPTRRAAVVAGAVVVVTIPD